MSDVGAATVDAPKPPPRPVITLLGQVFSLITGACGIAAMVWALGIKGASGTFVTREDLAKQRAEIMHEFETKMDGDRKLVDQRLSTLSEKIDALGKTVTDDGKEQNAKLTQIYTLLINRGGK